MTQKERDAFIKHFFEEYCVKVYQTKGKEYSRSEDDVNSNFKRLASELNLGSKKVLYIYLKKHLDAITNYINQGQVESEPIESRIGDAINYLFILASLIEEEFQAKPSEWVETRAEVPLAKPSETISRCPAIANDLRWHLQCRLDQGHKEDHSF